MNQHFWSVYELRDPRPNLPPLVYVGMTNDPDRRFMEHLAYNTPSTAEWIKEMVAAGVAPKMTIAFRLSSKHEALTVEGAHRKLLKSRGEEIACPPRRENLYIEPEGQIEREWLEIERDGGRCSVLRNFMGSLMIFQGGVIEGDQFLVQLSRVSCMPKEKIEDARRLLAEIASITNDILPGYPHIGLSGEDS